MCILFKYPGFFKASHKEYTNKAAICIQEKSSKIKKAYFIIYQDTWLTHFIFNSVLFCLHTVNEYFVLQVLA